MFNLPNTLINYQIIQIRIFNFKVKYIKGLKNIITNTLLYLLIIVKALIKKVVKGNINSFIDAQILFGNLNKLLDLNLKQLELS